MSLIVCRECNKEYSDTSDVCIHCGYPTEKNTNALNDSCIEEPLNNENINPKKKKPIIKIIIIVTAVIAVLIIGVVIVAFSSEPSEEYDSTNNTTTEQEADADPYGYYLDVNNNFNDIMASVKAMSDMTKVYDGSQEWFDAENTLLSNINTILEEARNIDPPESKSELHNQYMKGVELFQDGITSYQNELYSLDENAFDQAYVSMSGGCALMKSVVDTLNEEQSPSDSLSPYSEQEYEEYYAD